MQPEEILLIDIFLLLARQKLDLLKTHIP